MLIKFSQEYKTQIPVTVELINPQDGNWMLLDNKVDVNAEIYGFGFDLFSYKLFGLKNITIDLSEFKVHSDTDPAFIIIPESYINRKVNILMEGSEQVLNTYPGQIKVDLSKAVTKTIPIKSNVVVYPKKGFKIKNVPVLTPKNLKFFGPSSLLSQIDFINTEVDTIRDIQTLSNTKIKMRLDSLKDFLAGKADVNLTVDVDELTSGLVEVKVNTIVNKKGLEIRVLPSKIKVYYQIGLSDYQKVSEKLIDAVVEIPDSDDLPDKLKVELKQVPDFITVTRIEPLFVEYLIIKK